MSYLMIFQVTGKLIHRNNQKAQEFFNELTMDMSLCLNSRTPTSVTGVLSTVGTSQNAQVVRLNEQLI